MYNRSDTVEVKATNMDEHLKELAAETWKLAITFNIQGDYEKCFECYKSLFHIIECYEFSLKKNISEIVDCLSEFIINLKQLKSSMRVTKATQVDYHEIKHSFIQLLGKLMSDLPKAYNEMGLWLKSIELSNDPDKVFSNKHFNTDHSNLNKNKKALLKLTAAEIVEDMTPAAIYNVCLKKEYDHAV